MEAQETTVMSVNEGVCKGASFADQGQDASSAFPPQTRPLPQDASPCLRASRP